MILMTDNKLSQNVLFSFNPIGQLCLVDGPDYSSRTVNLHEYRVINHNDEIPHCHSYEL